MIKTKIFIDGDLLRPSEDFHRQFARQLGISKYYGANLSALRDTLFGGVECPCLLIWKGHKNSKGNMGDDYYKILAVLESVHSNFLRFSEGFDFALE
ncbi:barstar family protein [Pseudomonas sp. NPDC007930]|uniref:barstar family protein n=1 Tax=Pseudomonas sp. NPDC007930 TaxID=3364417 RepID=UPI0036EF0DDC